MKTVKPLAFFLAIGLFLSTNLYSNESSTCAAVYQSPTAQIALRPFLTGLAQPLLVTNAGDRSHRLFIVERTGIIKVLPYGETQPTVFLDISAKVLADRLGGFVGLAFHPQFASNNRFFVHYVRQPDAAVVTAEYRVSSADGNRADVSSEKIFILQAKARDGHAGGSIEFGADGFLYVGLGDGSTGNDPHNNAQNIESLLGKILRIDVGNASGALPYSWPSSNPFFGSTAGRDEIFALGFRNPYRFSFDKTTDSFLVADAGEKNIEEVDLVTPRGNYGWCVMEGNACSNLNSGLCSAFRSIASVTQYSHENGRCSITGGYTYRGVRSTFPQGAYIFGDLCSGEIFMLQNGSQSLLLDTANIFLVSFGRDEEGEFYVIGLDGRVYKIVSANSEDPVVQLTAPSTRMKLKGNTVYPITWTASGNGLYRHDIQWSTDGGQSWEDVVGGLAGNVRSYDWRVPNIKSKQLRLRVISYGNTTTGQDESDEDLIIKPRGGN